MRHHRTVLILTAALLLGIAAFFYIDNIFLPIQFKRFLTTRAEALLGRKVTVETIDFRPLKGFIIKGVSVARKDDAQKPFFHIDEVTFNLLLAPVFRRKAVILPSIRIKNPYLYLARDEKGVWNYADLMGLKKDLKRKNSFAVLLRKLILEGGVIQYQDTSREQPFFESFENINLYATLSLNKGVRFVFQGQVPQQRSSVGIKGNYNLFPKKLTAQFRLDNIPLTRYLPFFYRSAPYILLADGVLTSGDFGIVYEGDGLKAQGAFLADGARVRVGETKEMTGTLHVPHMLLTWRDHKWNAQGEVRLPAARVKLSDGKSFEGDVTADLNLLTIFGYNMTSQGNVTVDNARLALGENRFFKGRIRAENASLVKGDGKIRLQGNIDISGTDLTFDDLFSLKGDISTTGTNLVWTRDDAGNYAFDVTSGMAMDNAQAAFKKEGFIKSRVHVPQVGLSVENGTTTVSAGGRLESTEIALASNRRFQGSPQFDFSLKFDPKADAPLDYNGTVTFTDGILTGIPHLDTLYRLKGAVGVSPGHLETDGLTLNAKETDIALSGTLDNFDKPAVDVKASSDKVDVQSLLTLFPALKNKLRAEITGEAAVVAAYNGPLRSPSDAKVQVTAQWAGGTVTHAKIPEPLTNISGQLDYTNDLLKWSHLKADYKNVSYASIGQFSNLSRPTIDADVKGGVLDLSAQIKVLHSALQVTLFTGSWFHSAFDLKGDLHFFEDAPADIDLRGKITLDLKDTAELFPSFKSRLEQLKPAGLLSAEGIYKGTLPDWRNWQLALDVSSAKISLNGNPFLDLTARFAQRDQAVSKCGASAKIYAGDMTFSCSADLQKESAPFSATLGLAKLDLGKMREAKETKNRELAGILSLKADLKGGVPQWRDLTGEGSLTIADGNLWRWHILGEAAKALLIPEFKSPVFTDASAGFTVHDRKIFSNNAHMTSRSVTLDGKGWIDFKQNLNFDITPTFSELTILKSRSMKKAPTSVITQTPGYLNIKLTGTVGDPHFQIEKSPMKILKKTIGDTTATIKEVIGGIVDGVLQQ